MIYPIDKIYITQLFGKNPQIYSRFGLKGHNGIDFRTRFPDSPLGRRYVVAVLPGKIEQIRNDKDGYGLHIRIRHKDGSMTIYGHLTRVYVDIGKSVEQGERIGLTGNTGFSSGPHLHFEVRPYWEKSTNGYAGAVDPLPFLEGKKVLDVWDRDFIEKWEGKMIIDTEDLGKGYYVYKGRRHYIKPELMKDLIDRKLVTGFKHKDIIKIPLD